MKRNTLLLFIGILASILLVSCKKEQGGGGDSPQPQPQPQPQPSETMTVYGQVKGSDGALLSGVSVSDGTVCVMTDANGDYEIPSALDENVKFIFVTTPEGYSAPVQNGIPVFYKRMSELKKSSDGTYRDVNFTLEKISGDPDRYTVLISADPQPRNSTAGWDNFAYHGLDCCKDLYRDWRETAAGITGRPVYGIVLGDIVHENMTLFKQYTDALASNGFATYNLPGNHDHDLDKEGSTGGSNMIGLQTFEKNFGPTNYSVEMGKIHVVVMDDMYVPYDASGKCPKSGYSTGFTDNSWTWLQNDLALVDRSKTIFFCAHGTIYMQPGGTEYGTRTNYHLSDVAHLLAKFSKTHAWFGHSHIPYNHIYAADDKKFPNVESHMVPRSTGELWTNERLAGGAPRGYVIVDVDGEKVSWVFKPVPYQSSEFVGKHGEPDVPYMNYTFSDGIAKLKDSGAILDEKYQIVVYPPTAHPDKQGYLVANVYWWDSKWSKPVWTSSEGESVEMKLYSTTSGFYDINDKKISEFYIANEPTTLGAGDYTWNKNVHTLFQTWVGTAPKSGTVSVKDRFGNTWSTSISWQ